MLIRSELLENVPGIISGFGTTQDPISPLFPSPFQNQWEVLRPKSKQVHGTDIVRLEAVSQECGQADGFYTFKAGLPIGIMTADCVPILLANKTGTGVAAIHAGWRGTKAHILRRLFEQLQAAGEKASDWVACVGPAIRPCCYEVSESLASDFLGEFKYLDPNGDWIVPAPRHLDLQAVNSAELKHLGVSEVEVQPYCTFCSQEPLFQSYRRSAGQAGRQWSIISRVEEGRG